MVIHESDRRVVRSMWGVAAGMIEHRDPAASAVSRAALERPCAATIRALIAAGEGRPWLPSVLDALVAVGIAASEDVLGE